jgi:hypothetical protein
MKWIKVSERLPEKKDDYLTTNLEFPCISTFYTGIQKWSCWHDSEYCSPCKVVYWAELPQPPKGDE